jgi:type IV pilus assembly protein PilB
MPDRPPPDHLPLLISDDAALARYLAGYQQAAFAPKSRDAGIDLAGWMASGEDACEPCYRHAQRLTVPLLRLPDVSADPETAALLPPGQARRLRVVPLRSAHGLLAVAMEDPANSDALAAIQFVSSDTVVPLMATERGMRDAIARNYDHVEDRETARQLGVDASGAADPSEAEAQRLARERPVVRIVHGLIADAVARRASDIHLRPCAESTDVLYRIDDEMVPVRSLLRALHAAVVSRIKVLGAMNLAEHRRPQDGRTSFVLEDGTQVDLRISVLPAVFGESVVVRLLDTRESLWSLDQLGLEPDDRRRIDDVMSRSHGMFLATGPTGCGKSTTLYAMLLELRRERINILTIEDPVEFHIGDIQQMQVNRAAGFTFATAMRNFLRHDPDVIMVGEIRDRETADIAVESALTGHLLLSTLHTNTAATTITRLLDLGVEAYLLRASLLAVISQRLVRLTCPHCRAVEAVDPHVREALGVRLDEVFHHGLGCSQCEGLGVFRRQAVYELLVMSPQLRELVVPGAEADVIHRVAVEEGMRPLTEAAVTLARRGAISLAEVWRVRAD